MFGCRTSILGPFQRGSWLANVVFQIIDRAFATRVIVLHDLIGDIADDGITGRSLALHDHRNKAFKH